MTYLKWSYPIITAVVVAVAVVVIWTNTDRGGTVGETVVRELDFPHMTSSIEQLSEFADVVVIGTVAEVVATGTDRGQNNEGPPIAYTLYKLDVWEALKGDVPDSIYVFRIDPSEFPNDPLTELAVDETVALYLYENPASLAPTITSITDTAYVPIALDNGVFDVETTGAVGRVNDDAIIRPRGISEIMFTEGTTFTAAAIREAIQPVSGQDGPVGNTH